MIAKDSCKIIELNQKQIISGCRTFTGKKKTNLPDESFCKRIYVFGQYFTHISIRSWNPKCSCTCCNEDMYVTHLNLPRLHLLYTSFQCGSCLDEPKGKSFSYCCHTTLTHISSSEARGTWACAFLTPEEDPSAQLIPLITSQPYFKWATPDNQP